MKNVVIYSTPTCHFCQMTKEFLKENNIEYTDYDVSTDAEKRQEMIEKSGQMGVPVIFVGDPSNPSLREPEGSSEPRTAGQAEMMIGFDKEKLSKALGL